MPTYSIVSPVSSFEHYFYCVWERKANMNPILFFQKNFKPPKIQLLDFLYLSFRQLVAEF